MLKFVGPATPLAPEDIDAEAAELGVEAAVLHAVRDLESAGSGFLPDGRPKILFEAHLFGRLTRHLYDRAYPQISAPAWDRSLYGAGGAYQYVRLGQAIALDRQAALMSASWGMFQLLGSNFAACGYGDVEGFVAAMVSGERAQLDAFTHFIVANRLDDELRAMPPQFAAFARGYNGPGYAANAYDVKLAAAWRKWRANALVNPNPAPRTAISKYLKTLQSGRSGPEVGALQTQLRALGFAIDVDNDFGPETQWAVVAFQKAHGLTPDGIVGPLTRAALDAAVQGVGISRAA